MQQNPKEQIRFFFFFFFFFFFYLCICFHMCRKHSMVHVQSSSKLIENIEINSRDEVNTSINIFPCTSDSTRLGSPLRRCSPSQF